MVWVLRQIWERTGQPGGGLDTEHVYEGRDALVAGGKLELSQRFSPLLERAV